MDLCTLHPVFNLYNDRWPILTQVPPQPPAKFVHDAGDRVGRAINSMVSNGVIVSGSETTRPIKCISWSQGKLRIVSSGQMINWVATAHRFE